MNKRLIACNFALALIFTTMAGSSSVATTVGAGEKHRLSPVEKNARMERVYAKFGGRLVKPGTGIGCTGFINAQSGVSDTDIQTVVNTISTQLKHQQKIIASKPLRGLPSRALVEKYGLAIGIFVVSDDNLPVMLVAPEDRWALVNVAKLRKGLKDDPAGNALFAMRCRGELQRAFSYACGAGSSQYDGNLMDITEVEQIDAINPELTVSDTTMRCQKYLKSIKVNAPVLVTYGVACREGWAPAPTNDVQKAIWDKVHQLPTKPIKILPETKKVKD